MLSLLPVGRREALCEGFLTSASDLVLSGVGIYSRKINKHKHARPTFQHWKRPYAVLWKRKPLKHLSRLFARNFESFNALLRFSFV